MGLIPTFLSSLRDLIRERVQIRCRNKIRRWPAWDYTCGCESLMSGATHILALFFFFNSNIIYAGKALWLHAWKMQRWRRGTLLKSLRNMDTRHNYYVLPGCLSVHLNLSLLPCLHLAVDVYGLLTLKKKSQKLSHKYYSHPTYRWLTF